ncbi:MAG: Asp23/Gls24 family envelope stress response protein [Candidatus Omnitrophica bacterium]|nr:Asp23/Gls24 family envelope stress response protein [Candidatus Omnitrophota bacterium]
MSEKEKKNDLGVLKINNEVIASIARNAALQVDGVESVKRGILSLVFDLFSKGYHNKGISLDISESEVKIGVTIVVRYGVTIPDVSALVQENIRTAIEEMTGLSVSEVNVNIADIHAEESEN